jgi:CRISPR/Cas system-associated protein Cas7 (RAMP superfamily)
LVSDTSKDVELPTSIVTCYVTLDVTRIGPPQAKSKGPFGPGCEKERDRSKDSLYGVKQAGQFSRVLTAH